MAFKRLEGLTKNGTPITLFKATAVNAEQFKLAQDMIAANHGEPLMSRKTILSMNESLRPGKAYMPYFISKNVACKTKTFGIYDLSKLKLSAAAKAAGIEIPSAEIAVVPPAEKAPAARKRKKAEVVVEVPLGIEAPAE